MRQERIARPRRRRSREHDTPAPVATPLAVDTLAVDELLRRIAQLLKDIR